VAAPFAFLIPGQDAGDWEEPMVRLHGFRFSNYHNVVKVVLLEKGIPFEEVVTYPPADEAYRAKNPTGKYPCLEIENGTFLGESKVILNYLEDAYPDVPLLPAEPSKRARVRELMEVIDLYLELPARRLYPEVFSRAGKVSDEVRGAVRPLLSQGVAALKELARLDPYIAGADLSLADFSATFHLVPVSIASKAIYGEDFLAALPAVKRHRELMNQRETVQRVRAEQLADQQSFMQRPTG
jgi:glutathione S-transferase